MKSFKIDYAACKTSPGGNIMAKIENFQSHFKKNGAEYICPIPHDFRM